jgi:hypothetical protein
LRVIALELQILAGTYAVSRLSPDEPVPEWAQGELVALTRTPDELSVVSAAESVPESVRSESNWRALRVTGPLDFALVGILAALSGVLAQAGIPIFALSTFDTDYLLVGDRDLERAVCALEAAGHRVVPAEDVPDAATGQR